VRDDSQRDDALHVLGCRVSAHRGRRARAAGRVIGGARAACTWARDAFDVDHDIEPLHRAARPRATERRPRPSCQSGRTSRYGCCSRAPSRATRASVWSSSSSRHANPRSRPRWPCSSGRPASRSSRGRRSLRGRRGRSRRTPNVGRRYSPALAKAGVPKRVDCGARSRALDPHCTIYPLPPRSSRSGIVCCSVAARRRRPA